MVSKVLALAVIVAAVGAVAVETPLAGKSESGIESPAARSAEYEDAEEYGRDLGNSDRSIDHEDAEEVHGRALKKSWKKEMKQDVKAVVKRVESAR